MQPTEVHGAPMFKPDKDEDIIMQKEHSKVQQQGFKFADKQAKKIGKQPILQSDVQRQVHPMHVVNRILTTTIPLPIGEIFGSSKEVSQSF